jgi:hypothetical protein
VSSICHAWARAPRGLFGRSAAVSLVRRRRGHGEDHPHVAKQAADDLRVVGFVGIVGQVGSLAFAWRHDADEVSTHKCGSGLVGKLVWPLESGARSAETTVALMGTQLVSTCGRRKSQDGQQDGRRRPTGTSAARVVGAQVTPCDKGRGALMILSAWRGVGPPPQAQTVPKCRNAVLILPRMVHEPGRPCVAESANRAVSSFLLRGRAPGMPRDLAVAPVGFLPGRFCRRRASDGISAATRG